MSVCSCALVCMFRESKGGGGRGGGGEEGGRGVEEQDVEETGEEEKGGREWIHRDSEKKKRKANKQKQGRSGQHKKIKYEPSPRMAKEGAVAADHDLNKGHGTKRSKGRRTKKKTKLKQR